MSDEEWNSKVPHIIEEVYQLSISLGGKISGEHGIGLIRKRFLTIALDEKQVKLMKQIKKVFDPKNILNPGKIWEDSPAGGKD